MTKLDLNTLNDADSTGLSPQYGGFLAEAASVCLEHNLHAQPTDMAIEGHFEDSGKIHRIALHPNSVDSFADLDEAAEYGAMGVAVAFLCQETGMQVVRSPKDGGGFDFWVGKRDDNYVFQNKARLEVSGILKNSRTHAKGRLKSKMKQTEASDNCNLPAYGVVVEFSKPLTLTGKR